MKIREKNRNKKATTINQLEETFAGSKLGVLTDFRGLTTGEMNEVRRKLDAAEIKYQVVKNTLARFAAERTGKEGLLPLFHGPIAIAFGSGEATEAAKILTEHIRTNKSAMTIKGGFLINRVLTTAEVERLATLPPRDILIAKMLGGMQSPIVMLVNCLASPIRGMLGVLQARINQLEGA